MIQFYAYTWKFHVNRNAFPKHNIQKGIKLNAIGLTD